MENTDGMGDDDFIKAKFEDGTVYTLSQGNGNVKVSEWNEMMKKGKTNTGAIAPSPWEGEHSVTHNRLLIRYRQDRKLLCALFEQGHQICQVTCDLFMRESDIHLITYMNNGDQLSVPEDSIKEAAKFMIKIAEEYAAGKLQPEDLYEQRDIRARALGLTAKRRKWKKPVGEAEPAKDEKKKESTAKEKKGKEKKERKDKQDKKEKNEKHTKRKQKNSV